MRICSIDDDIHFSDALKNAFHQYLTEHDTAIDLDFHTSFQDADLTKGYDFVFLDIDMPGQNGFEIAEKIHQAYRTNIVFVTSLEEYVYDSFQYHPYGFIRKSRLKDDLERLLDTWLKESLQKISIYHDYQKINIAKDRIEKIEVSGNTIIVCCETRKYESRISLKAFIKEHPDLDAMNLVQINQSCIVNLQKIRQFDNPLIVLSSGDRLFVSRKYLSSFKVKYYTFER